MPRLHVSIDFCTPGKRTQIWDSTLMFYALSATVTFLLHRNVGSYVLISFTHFSFYISILLDDFLTMHVSMQPKKSQFFIFSIPERNLYAEI